MVASCRSSLDCEELVPRGQKGSGITLFRVGFGEWNANLGVVLSLSPLSTRARVGGRGKNGTINLYVDVKAFEFEDYKLQGTQIEGCLGTLLIGQWGKKRRLPRQLQGITNSSKAR
jgi:hypothetical protein